MKTATANNNCEQAANDQVIAVFDSGFGGLTVLRELQRTLPHEQFIYLGDTARTPYGPRGRETILRYSLECAEFLFTLHKIKLLVVACNTASAVALEALSQHAPCQVIGTIDQAVESAMQTTRVNRIGVIGTEATISSEVYQQALRSRNPALGVIAKACPLFVPLVEQGMFEGEIVDKIVAHYLTGLRDQQIDTLILGCTHYPLLKQAISNFFKESVEIIECSTALASEAKRNLEAKQNLRKTSSSNDGAIFFVTDGVAQFSKLAALFLQTEGIKVSKVDISEGLKR